MAEPSTLLTDWIASARRRPVAFAQVREDAALDLEILDACPAHARVAMIASGGCTAALLAASPKTELLFLVDAVSAQLALTRLKLDLLNETPQFRAELLGHAPQRPEKREALLLQRLGRLGLPQNALGPIAEVAASGLDFCGRYEAVFRRLAAILEELGPQRLDGACADAFALPGLTALFGESATANAARPFAEHFHERLSAACRLPGAGQNPYLSLMMKGRLPPGRTLPWLGASIPKRLPEVETFIGGMREALDGRKGEFDFIHLSNILDWLQPDACAELLIAARRALKPRGFVLVRQLNSTLNIPALESGFDWQRTRGMELLSRDRSSIYARLHLGTVR